MSPVKAKHKIRKDVARKMMASSKKFFTECGDSEIEFFRLVSSFVATETEKVRAYFKAKEQRRRANNPEAVRETSRKQYWKDPEKYRRLAREARKKIKQDPNRSQAARDKKRNYIARRAETNVWFKVSRRIRTRINQALRSGYGKKAFATMELLGCSVQDYVKYIESLWEPGMSWDNYGQRGWVIDHIVPCKHFDMGSPEEQKQCFNFLNTRPMWAFDNLSKGASIDYDQTTKAAASSRGKRAVSAVLPAKTQAVCDVPKVPT